MKNLVLTWIVLVSAFMLIFSACHLSSILSGEKYENYTIFAQTNAPELIDRNVETIAEVPDDEIRQFTIEFAEPKQIRKIVIHNHNLYRFKIEYWDERLQKWKILRSVQQRRNIEGTSRIQPKYTLKGINFATDKLRIDVSRTVDDRVITKTSVEPDDKIINVERRSSVYGYKEYYRILKRSPASLREVEIYGMPESEELF